ETKDWWRGRSPGAIVNRTMRRLNAKGSGIILRQAIHRRTATALPILLNELKANGYNVVHVVAGGERPKSIPELMASPAPNGKASPTELTKAPNGNDLTTRQSHRIKKRRVSKQHPTHWWFQADQVTTTKRPSWVFSGY